MKLPSNSREYATWTFSGATPSATLEVSFDDGDSWHPLQRATLTTARVLVAGPHTTSNPNGTVVLTLGKHAAQVRVVDGLELPVRGGGVIEVWDMLD